MVFLMFNAQDECGSMALVLSDSVMGGTIQSEADLGYILTGYDYVRLRMPHLHSPNRTYLCVSGCM